MRITEEEKKKREIIFLRHIYTHIRRKHISPTLREIAFGLGISGPATAQTYRDSLIEQGLLKMITKSPRSMYLTEEGLDALGVK